MKKALIAAPLLLLISCLGRAPAAEPDPAAAKRDLTTAEREAELLDLLQSAFDLDYAKPKAEAKGEWAAIWSSIHKKGREYSRYRFRHPDDPAPPAPAKKSAATTAPKRGFIATKAGGCGAECGERNLARTGKFRLFRRISCRR